MDLKSMSAQPLATPQAAPEPASTKQAAEAQSKDVKTAAQPLASQQAPKADESKDVKPEEKASGSPHASTTDPELDRFVLFFARLTVDEVLPRPTRSDMHLAMSNGVVCVEHLEHLTRVFGKLVAEGFLSVPVLDKWGRYLNLLETLDLVMYTVAAFDKLGYDWSDEQWDKFLQSQRTFTQARVADVLIAQEDSAEPRQHWPLLSGCSLLAGAELLAITGAHSLPIVDHTGRVTNILTQSMVISLLSQYVNKLGQLKNVKVHQMLPFLNSGLFSVTEDSLVLDAFKMMTQKNISGLAVVDKAGMLTDVLSARDLRGMGTDASRWKRLSLPIKTFKSLTRKDFSMQMPDRPCCVVKDDTLETVLARMKDGDVHRLVLVEGKMATPGPLDPPVKPLLMISQGDVLKFVAARWGCRFAVPRQKAAGAASAPVDDRKAS